MKVLVTGGAGFIGSHIAAAYVADGNEVVVLDDLSTGYVEHVPQGARFMQGSITDLPQVRAAMRGADLVFHEAASRAVLRSVEDPVGTVEVNTLGTVNVLVAARDVEARRLVLASSSSIYGGQGPIPTPESAEPSPRSPYAVTKLSIEHHARVFSELYGLETVSLRYFNVFGPRQRPDSDYAAVIPLFTEALLDGRRPNVHGDGKQSRDFTYIDDVVRANRLAAGADGAVVSGKAYNIARGDTTTVLELLEHIADLVGVEPDPVFVPPRAGDVRRSCADISSARRDLGYEPNVPLTGGLERMVDWYRLWRREGARA